jgi:hypothetical protein
MKRGMYLMVIEHIRPMSNTNIIDPQIAEAELQYYTKV